MDGRAGFVCKIKNKTEKTEHLFLQGVDLEQLEGLGCH